MSLRKRFTQLQRYPHPKFMMRMLDRLVLLVGIFSPLMTVPQLMKIFIEQDASGVSALSWGSYAVCDIPFVMYGIAHKEPPLIATYTIWLVMNAAVAFGAVIYG